LGGIVIISQVEAESPPAIMLGPESRASAAAVESAPARSVPLPDGIVIRMRAR